MKPSVLAFALLAAPAAWADLAPGPTAAPLPPVAECSAPKVTADLKAAARTVTELKAQTTRLKALLPAAPDDACRDALMKAYYDYYGDCMTTAGQQIPDEDTAAAKRARLSRALREVGWEIASSEAGDYVSEQTPWLLRTLGKTPTGVWREYLQIDITQRIKILSHDAGLKLSWKEIRQRLQKYEAFVAKYPAFEKTAEVKGNADVLFRCLIFGLDNTPAFDSDDQLAPELRTELEAYAADKSAARRTLVAGYLKILARTEYKQSDASKRYLAKHKLESMEGQDPG